MSAGSAAQASPASVQPARRAHAILAAGERLAQSMLLPHQCDSPEVQRMLFAARQRFGHALCTCRPQPLKLQIRLRGDKCHLAVWPGEHGVHDRDCLFFQPPVAPASADGDARTAPSPSSPTRRASLGSPVSQSRAPGRIGLWIGAGAPADTALVSVMSLAQRLWDAADLCDWQPQWTRDWARTRYQLLRSAGGFSLNGCPLEHLIFVPRPYRPAAAVTLNREWTAFTRSLRGNRVLPPRLLVAPVRAWRGPHDGQHAALWLRHLRTAITLQPACWDFLARTCLGAIASSRLGPPPTAAAASGLAAPDRRPELVGFFLVEAAAPDDLRARAAWLLPVHPDTWIPASDEAAVRRIDALREAGRAFHCGFGAAAQNREHAHAHP